MRVLITGGAGFLGQKLARALLARGTLTNARGETTVVSRVTLVDVAVPPKNNDPRVTCLAGDLADPDFVTRAFEGDVDSVFHLAAVVSGEAEQNFDLGWRVNVDATRLVLEACRRQDVPPKLVFSSSIAVFGGALPDVLQDDQILTPQSSYGAQKAVGELLVTDYSRKGFIDGRSLRLPTVAVRPGKPNKAASSFASGIVREPLNGIDAVCPVLPDTRMWLLSPRTTVANLIVGHETLASALRTTRSVTVPGISVSVGEMIESLRRVAGDAVAARVSWKLDPAVDGIVQTWPRNFEAALGRKLGMTSDPDFDSVVRQYLADELGE